MATLAETVVSCALKNGTYGCVDDCVLLETPFLQLQRGIANEVRVLGLVTIYIPPAMRRKGMCTSIIDKLEKHAADRGMHFQVGPFVTEDSDYIIKVLQRRGYQPNPPFSLMKRAPSSY